MFVLHLSNTFFDFLYFPLLNNKLALTEIIFEENLLNCVDTNWITISFFRHKFLKFSVEKTFFMIAKGW